MKTYREELWFEIPTRRAFINITPKVERALAQSGIREGLCLVNAMHITASVFINDDESGLHADYERWLEALKGELAGFHSIRVNRQWRIIFRWEAAEAREVRIIDYHRG